MARKPKNPLVAVLSYIRNAEVEELKTIAAVATVELAAREPKQAEPRKRVKKAETPEAS